MVGIAFERVAVVIWRSAIVKVVLVWWCSGCCGGGSGCGCGGGYCDGGCGGVVVVAVLVTAFVKVAVVIVL